MAVTSFVKSINVLECALTAQWNHYIRCPFTEVRCVAGSLNALAIRLDNLRHLRFMPYVPVKSTELSE